ncbi:hypothetical protein [Benzoatithermus flavus]|uniref:Uncharacterized protein n=1 Tax=Benzoatithermus flavus TaxID=3108223 RepID=A0ABU8XSE8_9PROT
MIHRIERLRKLGRNGLVALAGLAGILLLAGPSSRAATCPPASGEELLGGVPAVASDAGCGVQEGKAIRVALGELPLPSIVPDGIVPVAEAAERPRLPPLVIQIFSATSGVAAHPHAEARVPFGYKLIGGGARVDYNGAGNILTASYPMGRRWIADSKDHDISDPAIITAYAIGLFDPFNRWDVQVRQSTSAVAPHPTASVSVPFGYVMTGGGARVDYAGNGNLLTASFPSSRRTWEARSKDHIHPDPASITAYVIGIRARNGARGPRMIIASATTGVAAHPSGTVSVGFPFQISGGGAIDNWTGAGNLLTAIYPSSPSTWTAAGKDHEVSDPANLTIYAIGLAR